MAQITLDANHKEWLYQHYALCKPLEEISEEFGVTVLELKNLTMTSAAAQYAETLIYSGRNELNLLAATQMLQQMRDKNVKIPIDVLIKIYNATVPKVAPIGFQLNIETLVKEAENVADRMGLDAEARQTMIDFVKKRDERIA